MSKCKEHDCHYEIRQMEQGKTVYVCPKCEKERMDKLKNMFGITEVNDEPKLPIFYR